MPIALVLALAGLALAGAYAAVCRFWPYVPCRRCHGAGKLRSPSGRAWRVCPRCNRSGERLRIGRRLFNSASRTTRSAR